MMLNRFFVLNELVGLKSCIAQSTEYSVCTRIFVTSELNDEGKSGPSRILLYHLSLVDPSSFAPSIPSFVI